MELAKIKAKVSKSVLLFRDFGLRFLILAVLYKILNMQEDYSKLLVRYLKNKYKNRINEISHYSNNKGNTKFVWSMWWQGVDNLPEILKITYESHKRYIISQGYQYVMISKDNYRDYLDVPDYIEKKLNNGTISFTHFSDLLRVLLLEKFGGAWIDITVLLTRPLDLTIFDAPFYSINNNKIQKPNGLGQIISECKWTGFLFATNNPHTPLFLYLKQCLLEYWLHYDHPIDYFLSNCLIRAAYEDNEIINEIIDKVPTNNTKLYSLQPILNDSFEMDVWNALNEDNYMFKVTQKITYTKSHDENMTYYGYLYSEFIDSSKDI